MSTMDADGVTFRVCGDRMVSGAVVMVSDGVTVSVSTVLSPAQARELARLLQCEATYAENVAAVREAGVRCGDLL